MTERLYYTDALRQEFFGKLVQIVEVGKAVGLVLDRTCFYPNSGGQPCDKGTLDDLKVEDVIMDEDRILHVVEEKPAAEVIEMRGRIDWGRRFDHMQQHSGQHLLSQAFLRVLKAETISFHMSQELSTIDLSVERLTAESIYAAEDMANQVIWENRPIKAHMVSHHEAAQLPLRKPSQRKGVLRLIEIEDFDYSACGGTHCTYTGQVGLIKVCRWERVKRRARVEFVCGGRALKDYRWKNRALFLAAGQLSVSGKDVDQAVRSQIAQTKKLKNELSRLQQSLLEQAVSQALSLAEKSHGVEIVTLVKGDWDHRQLNPLAGLLLNQAQKRVVLLAGRAEKGYLVLARTSDLDIDMREILGQALEGLDGRGGGSQHRAQGGTSEASSVDQALQAAVAAVKKLV